MNKKWLLIIFLIFGFFLLSRLIFIFNFPLFFDEAVYIDWAQYVSSDWVWRNTSLTLDGKQPLLIWLIALTLKIILDPIIAGRLVSVFCGGLSLCGIYLIAKKLFNQPVAVISIFLYSLIPFYLIYDGLALMDGLLLTISVYAGLLTIYLTANLKWLSSIGLGIVIGLGLLTKSSAGFFLLSIPLGLILFNKHTISQYLKYFGLMILSVVIAKTIEYIYLHRYFANITAKNSEFVKNLAEIINTPLNITLNHTWQVSGWLVQYLGVGVIGLSLVSFIISPKKRKVIYLWMLTLLPFVPYLLLSKQSYPRHLLFMSWPLLILASTAIILVYERIKFKKLWVIGVIGLIVMPHLVNSFLLLTNPLKAKLPEIERWQFLTGEPSGWGMEKLYSFFDGQRGKKLLILTDKPLGILPDGLGIRYFHKPNIKVVGLDEVNQENIKRFKKDYQPQETYLVLSWQDLPTDIKSNLSLKIDRPGKPATWQVYKTE